jgi:hypothetical protein
MLAQQTDRGLHAGKRRAQLVRDVVRQHLARLRQLLQLRGHAVDVFCHIDQLVAAPPAQRRGQTGLEPASRDFAQPAMQMPKRAGQVPSHRSTCNLREHTPSRRLARRRGGRAPGLPAVQWGSCSVLLIKHQSWCSQSAVAPQRMP